MLTLLIFLAVLSLLVFAHEFGHFFVARIFKVRVDEFGIGFPPRMWGKKKGNTVYSINWIPLGGFVRLKGEAGEHAHDADSFARKPVYARASIAVAGVVMNLVLAAVLFTIGLWYGLPHQAEYLPSGAHVRDAQVAIGQVLPGSPADTADLVPGEVIESIDGNVFVNVADIQQYVADHDGVHMEMVVSNFGEERTVEVVPEVLVETGTVGVGMALFSVGIVSYPWYVAPVRAVELTVMLTWEIMKAFGSMIVTLVTQGQLGIDVSGPVGIAVLSGRAAELGFSYLLQFTAILSINLAIINVVPFPALDGGRLLFLILEKIRRRPVSLRLEARIHQTGFLLLLAVVLLVTYRDLLRFFDGFF